MTDADFRELVDAAAHPYRPCGRHAWHFAKGKLARDPVFRHLLSHPLLPARGRLLDLGCGQGVLTALLRAATDRHARGGWPAGWPAPPSALATKGIELAPKRVRIAKAALGDDAVTQGDIRDTDLPRCDAIVILDVLLYLHRDEQAAVLARCAEALNPDGVLVLREADAHGGLPFQITRWAEQIACAARGRWRQSLTYRPAVEWSDLLNSFGFATEALPMSQGTPFANTLFIARQSKSSVQICPFLRDSASVSIPSTMKPQPTTDTVQNS
ncbi:methyltransferase domain-containing protein [Azospirillum melinis]|uniref:Methyltransferase domain-containing protein n=1 Tax=Azospirillum melinis TaxID=328839 RepID=A0ABX2KQW8_9PROT|nr:class I SAM-dependent methyltransferase [Azospirillum melinis]MBP2306698.1 SAM-dependent methyltransferase [Azospirillum melinis]NUB03881.1 methyltransferase domain-containing protein [Azospirillum melinis]